MNMKRRICKIISIFLSMVIILECGIIENVRAEEAKIEESEKIHTIF